MISIFVNTHIIRLRGPWNYRLLVPSAPHAANQATSLRTGTINLPGDWRQTFGDEFQGRVELTRRFGRPTGLEAGARVELVIEPADACSALRLNGDLLEPVVQPPAARFDVTHRLRPRNTLEVTIEFHVAEQGGLAALPDVRLEIGG
jgi:hypothetical protein